MKHRHRLDHKEFLVPPGKKIRLKDYDPAYTGGFKDKDEAHQALIEDVSELAAAQDLLWASKEYSLIIIFQALDAAGKDSTIKHVMSGVNPQGVDVYSFKAPTDEERLHHFLWRPSQKIPAHGRIAIFNRSYYEEVLVVRVHPEWLEKQWLPREQRKMKLSQLWKARYAEILNWEQSTSHSDIRIIKFFLNVSKEEQAERFVERMNNPAKHWKFAAADLEERKHWDDYMTVYEEMLGATSTERSPWYIIPADKKWFMRACVADIIASNIASLDLKYPKLAEKELAALAVAKKKLEREMKG